MLKMLSGKYVAITGASSGIGAEMAIRLSKAGAVPLLLARSESKLAGVAERLPGPCHVRTLDVTSAVDVKQAFESFEAEVGPIDVLINNAGYGLFQPATEMRIEDFVGMMNVNYFGLVHCTKAVLPNMMERGRGHIVNIASMAGKMGFPQTSGYAATKHAVLGFTNSLRLELAERYPGITVTSVNPGPIRTPFFDIADPSGGYLAGLPSWFVLNPESVADAVVQAIVRRKQEVNLPRAASLGLRLAGLLPTRVLARLTRKK